MSLTPGFASIDSNAKEPRGAVSLGCILKDQTCKGREVWKVEIEW